MADANVGNFGKYVVSSRMKTVYSALMFVGLIGFVLTIMRNPERAWLAYLLGLFYFTSLALGGLFFTVIQHVTKAGWSVNVRRVSESFSAFLPIAAVLAAVFILGAPKIYAWLDHAKVAADHLLEHKAAYLNKTFFIIRLVVFFAIWLVFQRIVVGRSLRQDETGDVNITHSLVRVGIAFLLLFALSYSLFSVDLLMSVDPHFFSTIYGVYCFAGLFQSTMAFMILTLLYLRHKGLLRGYVTDDHMHDLGKFMFAFTVFWAYIAFSQYMLIRYANMPEETFLIIPRTEGGWLWMSILLLLSKFIVPFIAMLPRWAKRTPAHVGAVAVLILVMQFVDLHWLVYPAINEEHVMLGLQEVTVFLGSLGLFLFAVTRFLSSNNLVPIKDPRIHESLHHHVVY